MKKAFNSFFAIFSGNASAFFLPAHFAAAVFALAIFSSCMMPPKKAEPHARTVTVSGTGIVSVQADTATINFSVVTRNLSVIDASKQNAEVVSKVRNALIGAGFSADSIITDRYNVMQEVSYRNGAQIRGDYRVTNSIHVTLKNVANIGKAIDAAIAAGANELSSVEFGVSDMEGAVREARTAAVKQAYEAANLMVSTAGAELGKILSIEEQRGGADSAVLKNSAKYANAFDEDAASTSVTPGKQKIAVTVLCTYEIQ